MSIRDEIKKHVAAGKLYLLEPLVESQTVGRYLFASSDVYRAVQEPFARNKRGKRHVKMRNVLDTFIGGGWISVAEKPRDKPPNAFLARVDPPNLEVWDIRCTHPARIRVFGRFSERDHFVALTYEYREHLKGKAFDRARDRFRSEWQTLFPNEPVFGGNHPNVYLSKNYHVV